MPNKGHLLLYLVRLVLLRTYVPTTNSKPLLSRSNRLKVKYTLSANLVYLYGVK